MQIKDHFLTNETFELIETQIPGILKTTPLPSDLAPYYESKAYISHHQDSGSLKEKIYKFAQRFNLNYKSNILLQYLPSGTAVLDYGCGAGEFLKFIDDDFNILGYEPNYSARKAAESKIGKSKLITEISEIPDAALDAVTMWHVLEHIENQEDVLNNMYKKLKINGLLFIAVPNYRSFDADYYKEWWASYDVPRHVYHFSKEGMNTIFNTPQWKMLNIKPLILDAFYISILSEKYQKKLFSWFKGGILGAISNIKASKTGEFSSLIYIIQKK